MPSFLIYVVFVLLIAIANMVVAFNFIRYRFKGDKTLVFIGLFALLFVADIIFTFNLFNTPLS